MQVCRPLVTVVVTSDFSTKHPMFVRNVGENYGKNNNNHCEHEDKGLGRRDSGTFDGHHIWDDVGIKAYREADKGKEHEGAVPEKGGKLRPPAQAPEAHDKSKKGEEGKDGDVKETGHGQPFAAM